MSLVVAEEAERFVFRPYSSARAVYYAVVFLNQIVLSRRSNEGANCFALTGCICIYRGNQGSNLRSCSQVFSCPG